MLLILVIFVKYPCIFLCFFFLFCSHVSSCVSLLVTRILFLLFLLLSLLLSLLLFLRHHPAPKEENHPKRPSNKQPRATRAQNKLVKKRCRLLLFGWGRDAEAGFCGSVHGMPVVVVFFGIGTGWPTFGLADDGPPANISYCSSTSKIKPKLERVNETPETRKQRGFSSQSVVRISSVEGCEPSAEQAALKVGHRASLQLYRCCIYYKAI